LRILLDENLDWRLRRDLPGHTVESVPLIGWAGLKNGVLLARAEKRFDVFITMDSSLPKRGTGVVFSQFTNSARNRGRIFTIHKWFDVVH
jgi:hypothetical protein